GGKVTAQSAGLEKGSTFTLTLPRVANGPSPVLTLPAELPPVQLSPRILVVDDNVDAAMTLGTILEIAGYEVVIEHSAKDALNRAATEVPKACLLDIGLPDMDGVSLARQLRDAPGTASTLMVAITGYGQNSDREKSLNAGFDHHLVKPVDRPRLLEILSSL